MENDSRDNRASRERDRRSDNLDEIDAIDVAFMEEAMKESSNLCPNEVDKLYTQIKDILLKAATIQASAASLSVGEEFKVYYERVVKPSVDIVYFLSFALQNTAATANVYQANAYGKKGEGKKALDVSYDILKQLEVSVDLLKDSLDCLVEKSKCL